MPKIMISANTDWYLHNFRTELARVLQEGGYDVTLVSPAGEFVPVLEENGFRWIEWSVSRKRTVVWEELESLFELVRIYRREKPDIVHHHTIKPVLYGSLAARLARVPWIVNSITGRGYIFLSTDLKARLLKKIVNPFYKYVLRYPNNAVIFENQFDRQFFIDSGYVSESRSWIIEGVGVDPDKFHPTPEPDGVPIVLLAGRMLWDKGIGVLIDAARVLKVKYDIRIVLVGKPDPGNPQSIDEGVLRGWEKEGLVEWWGWRSDMPLVYQQCHIVVLPTMYGEGVPTSLIEGAACGKPLVASNNPGCLPIVKQDRNGFLVPQDDPGVLALALEPLITDHALRQKMGKESRKVFLEKFTHTEVNQATIGVYDHLFKTIPDLK
jgi:glycosyltransferase involved in cell wall biosynthesis